MESGWSDSMTILGPNPQRYCCFWLLCAPPWWENVPPTRHCPETTWSRKASRRMRPWAGTERRGDQNKCRDRGREWKEYQTPLTKAESTNMCAGMASGSLGDTCTTEQLDFWRAASRNSFRPRLLIRIFYCVWNFPGSAMECHLHLQQASPSRHSFLNLSSQSNAMATPPAHTCPLENSLLCCTCLKQRTAREENPSPCPYTLS